VLLCPLTPRGCLRREQLQYLCTGHSLYQHSFAESSRGFNTKFKRPGDCSLEHSRLRAFLSVRGRHEPKTSTLERESSEFGRLKMLGQVPCGCSFAQQRRYQSFRPAREKRRARLPLGVLVPWPGCVSISSSPACSPAAAARSARASESAARTRSLQNKNIMQSIHSGTQYRKWVHIADPIRYACDSLLVIGSKVCDACNLTDPINTASTYMDWGPEHTESGEAPPGPPPAPAPVQQAGTIARSLLPLPG
jgi:hypothetical protein